MKINRRRLIPVTFAVLALAAGTVPLASANASVTRVTATPGCSGSQLRVHLGQSEGAAGTTYQAVRFRNTGSTACVLDGYPRFVFLNRSGEQIGFPAKPTGRHHAVTIRPGQAGIAALGIPDYLNFPPARCHARHATRLRVTAPATSKHQLLTFKATVCTTKFGRSTSLAVKHHQ